MLLVALVCGLTTLAPAARAADVERAPVPNRLEIGPFRTLEGIEITVVARRDAGAPVLCAMAFGEVMNGAVRTATLESVCTDQDGAMSGVPDHRFDPVTWTGSVSATARSLVYVEDSTLQPDGEWRTIRATSQPASTGISLEWQGYDAPAPDLHVPLYYCVPCSVPSGGVRRRAAVTGVVRFTAFGDIHFGGTEPASTEIRTRRRVPGWLHATLPTVVR